MLFSVENGTDVAKYGDVNRDKRDSNIIEIENYQTNNLSGS